MKIGIIVLSRNSSSRLPGKALMRIKGKPILEYIVERIERVIPRQNITIATSTLESDNSIEAFAERVKVNCYRGSLENVAERFLEASLHRGYDFTIRINGDNIFLDCNLLGEVEKLIRTNKYDFISNVEGRTYPKGMSIEAVRVEHYQNTFSKISNKYYFEHVMAHLYERNFGGRKLMLKNNEIPEAAGIQFALDTVEDFERTKMIISRFTEPHYRYNLNEILQIFKNND